MPESANPMVSVVITTYNRSVMLRDRAIRSIQDQTFQDWECIIVDDGSTDDTEAVMRVLEKEDGRIRYVKIMNSGLAAARNVGIRAARGEYVAFTDDDDAYLPHYLELAMKVFPTLPADVGFLSGSAINIDDHGLRTSMRPPLEPVWRSPVGNGWVFRKECFTRSDIYFDEALKNMEDLDIRIRFDRAGWHGHVLDETCRLYYVNLDKRTAGAWSTNTKFQAEVYERFIKKNGDLYRQFGRDAIAWIYVGCGMNYLRGGAMKEGRYFVWRSFRLYPTALALVYTVASLFGYNFFLWFDNFKNRAMRVVRSRVVNAPPSENISPIS